MEKTNLENLNRLAKLFGTDRLISPEDIQEIRSILIGVLANNKKEVESLTEETKQAINSVLEKVLNEHDTYLEKTKQIAQEAKSETTEAINTTLKSLEEVKALCKEVMECKPENGKDADEEYVIGEVLNRIKLPEYKEIVLDDGGAIVDKINSLPVNEENQIDAKHIKNLPEGKGGRVISGGVTRKIVEQMIAAAGGGTPGGSTTQLQYNNAGAFGGISGATTDGTAVTFATDGLLANTLKSATSAGTLFESNSGTDVLLLGAGGGAGATFYGGVNVGGTLTVLGQGGTGGMVAGGASIGAGYTGISLSGTLTSSNYNFGGGTGDVNLYVNRPTGGKIFFRENNAAARVTFSASGLNGFETTSPTHTLTLASTSTGIALYNTADQTTNYERGLLQWSSNILTLSTGLGGSGTARALQLIAVGSGSNSSLTLTRASLPTLAYTWGSTATTSGSYVTFSGTNTASSGTVNAFAITPTINQSSTAGYTALLVNPTETTTGSGSKLLADFQVGGVSKFNVDNTGVARIITLDTNSLKISTTSNSVGGTMGVEFKYNSGGANTNLARIIGYTQTGGGGDILFETAASGSSAYSTKMTLTRAGALSVTGGITKRVVTTTDDSTAVIDVAVTDVYQLTAIANNTTFSFTGTPTDGQNFIIRYKDAGVSKTLTWTGFTAIGVTLPTATTAGKWGYVGVTYNSAASAYHVTAVTTEA